MSCPDIPVFDAVRRATDKRSSQSAYDAVLDQIGNNHEGTLFAEAEAAVEPLLEIALSAPGWPATTALNVLTEMIGSFQLAVKEPARETQTPR